MSGWRITAAVLVAGVVVALLGIGVFSARADDTPASAPEQQPPPRPVLAADDGDARLLFEAIVHDDPERAAAFFFPREPFRQVKAIPNPDRYYDRLRKRFAEDVHALHRTTPDLERATFERLDLGKRGGWVAVGEEGNRLPYWAARHATLYYRVGDEHRQLEVRVLITWQDRWYVIHLSEFHAVKG